MIQIVENSSNVSSLTVAKRTGVWSRVGRAFVAAALACALAVGPGVSQSTPAAPQNSSGKYYERTQDKGYRFERDGWLYVHLEGAPHDIGFQHGS